MKHTLGQWGRGNIFTSKYGWPAIVVFDNKDQHGVAEVWAIEAHEGELEGNAALIAAAPELLKALETIEAFASNKSVLGSWTTTLEIARAAIQKARGQQ